MWYYSILQVEKEYFTGANSRSCNETRSDRGEHSLDRVMDYKTSYYRDLASNNLKAIPEGCYKVQDTCYN